MAAGTCLGLMSINIGDEIVQGILPFIQQHIKNENWKFREAACFAFGNSISSKMQFRILELANQY